MANIKKINLTTPLKFRLVIQQKKPILSAVAQVKEQPPYENQS